MHGRCVHAEGGFAEFTLALLGALRVAPLSDRFGFFAGGFSHANASHGLWLEFGAWKGTTVQIMARHRSRYLNETPLVYSFDSFVGLPEDWRYVWRPGHTLNTVRRASKLAQGIFTLAGRPPELPIHIRPLVEWVVGWYNDTLPRFLSVHKENVSFLHMDSDLYSSTATVLRLLASRLHTGTVIVFDELFNYPEYQQHEIRALFEFMKEHDYGVNVLATSTHNIEYQPRVENFKQSCALMLVQQVKSEAACARLRH